VPATHTVESTPDTVRSGYLDPAAKAVATVAPGDTVLRDLGVGSHLFLPVAKPGGRIWLGDVHALHGDGVVDQTAIETAAEDLEIRCDLHKQVALPGPVVEPGARDGEAVARSVLVIIDPAAPPAIRAAALITQELRRDGGSWRIARRTVARAAGQR